VQVSTIGVVCGLGHWATPALGQPGQQSLALRCACSNINKRYVCVARGGGGADGRQQHGGFMDRGSVVKMTCWLVVLAGWAAACCHVP
jgi:hypothetical protein